MTNLDQLYLCFGSITPDVSSSGERDTYSLPMTIISLAQVVIRWPLNPAATPFLHRLCFIPHWNSPLSSVLPLLPQIYSLSLSESPPTNLDEVIRSSTSSTSLSLKTEDTELLGLDSIALINERVEIFRYTMSEDDHLHDQSNLMNILIGNPVLKKVIVDGSDLSLGHQRSSAIVKQMGILKLVCAAQKLELWRENWSTNNGKVNFDIK